jgi:hypothetical protein
MTDLTSYAEAEAWSLGHLNLALAVAGEKPIQVRLQLQCFHAVVACDPIGRFFNEPAYLAHQ